MQLKKSLLVLSISYFLLGSTGYAQTHPPFSAALERRLNQQVLAQQAKVQLTFDWEKEVHLRDVMSRPPRMGVGNPVIALKTNTTVCQGVLLEGNRRVVFPAVCLKNDDFLIKKVQISFSNGRQATGTANSTIAQGDMGYVRLAPDAAEGLRGVSVHVLKQGKGLQDSFGSAMTKALHQFFTSHGIAFKTRVCRIGRNSCRHNLQVGEPVFFKGKLVALVKKVPHRYGTVWGAVSEEALAVFRS